MKNLFSVLLFVFSPQEINSPLVDAHIALAALEQVGVTLFYSPGYVRLGYPNEDLPQDRGVCTDVIVRAFRKIGVDLQKEIHEDMLKHFQEYPDFWNMRSPDANIDHRRVPNLMAYFKRKWKSVGLDDEYKPGDIVAWRLSSGLYHIGIVSEELVPGKKFRFMIHNIGQGAEKEDVLNQYKIIGHYRW